MIVTGDEKDDWWWKHRGQFVGPRIELVEECLTETGLPLFMLRPADLISNASAVDVAVREDARNEIERATESADNDLPIGEDDSDASVWNAVSVHELLRRLDEEGAVQADVIRRAAQLGGAIERTEIYEIAGYDEDRMLRGFTRPSAGDQRSADGRSTRARRDTHAHPEVLHGCDCQAVCHPGRGCRHPRRLSADVFGGEQQRISCCRRMLVSRKPVRMGMDRPEPHQGLSLIVGDPVR